MSGDDPIEYASSKAITWASLAATAGEAWAQVAQMRARERAAKDMARAAALRADRQARYARDRVFWAPMLAERLAECGVREAGLAWAAAQSWNGDPEADRARDLALGRLRELRPDVMRLHDFLTADGVDPVVAMHRVAPLMDRPPAYPMRTPRPELSVPTSAAETAQRAYAPSIQHAPLPVSERDRLVAAVSTAELFYGQHLDGSWAQSYLRARGLESMTDPSSPWAVGYAPDGWTGLVEHLRGLGYSDAEMLAAGVASKTRNDTLVDRFRDRLMVSVRDAAGDTVGFVGRANPQSRSQRVPKYLNSPETALYHKGDLLLGLAERSRALTDGATPVVVEGVLDAEAVWLASQGRCVGVAPSGTAVTARQVDRLRNATDRPLVVALDGDQAGRQAALKVFDYEPAARAVVLPDGQDPASMWQDGNATELQFLLARPSPMADLVVDTKLAEHTHHLQFPEGRVSAMHAVAPTVAGLPARDVGRQVVRVAERLGLDTQAVSATVLDHISKPEPDLDSPARAGTRMTTPVPSR